MRRSNAHLAKPRREEGGGMDLVKPQLRSSKPGFRFPSSKYSKPKSRFYLYILISVTFLLFVCVFLVGDRNQETKKYWVVIDGGSTGTRIHVFKYEFRNGNLVLDFSSRGLLSRGVNPGLSAYAENPDSAGVSVAELMDFAKRNVPREQWPKTEARLMATAGMRLLKNADQEGILNVCRSVLRASGFLFQDDWASVISGSDEGLYSWVVANYALGTLGAEPAQTSGIIELGGASAQVTFVPREPIPPEFSRKVNFGNFTYNLYSHSLLHFGQNVAFNLLQDSLISGDKDLAVDSPHSRKPRNPCTPRGYNSQKKAGKSLSVLTGQDQYGSTLEPSGNFTECRSASLKILQKGKEKCSYQNCYIGSTFIPKLQGTFLATENFFHTFKFFGLGERALLSDLVVAGEQFCGEEWLKLTEKYHSLDDEDLLPYCFSSAYIVALLHDSLGITLDNKRIGYVNQVRDIPLDWALGAFILQTATAVEVKSSSWMATTLWDRFSPLLLLGIFLLLVVVSWFVSKWRKPELKTIYDLEKGKYIVTRINRYS